MVKKEKGKLYIKTPYNSVFVQKVKKLGAKWAPPHWVTDERNIDQVREILMDVYGKNDITSEKMVDVELSFPDGVESAVRSDLNACGRPIAVGFGRDSGAKPGLNVSITKGDVDTAGSAKNWYIKAEPGTVFILRDVPVSKTESYSGSGVLKTIENAAINTAALKEEKARLLTRLAEIEEKLGGNKL